MLLALLPHAPEIGRYNSSWLQLALRRGALTPEDVLTRAAPANRALAHLLRLLNSAERPADRQELGTRAAALTAERLGTDPETWAVCLQLLPTFAGTLTELCASAGATVRRPA